MIFRVKTWGGIGDVLLLTPSLRAIKQVYPDSRLEVECERPSHFELLLHNPYIDVLRLRRFDKGRLAKFYSMQLQFARNLFRPNTPFVGTDYGSLCPSLLTNKHATEIIAELLQVKLPDRKLDVFLTEEEDKRAEKVMEQYTHPIAIHVNSHCSKNQNWPFAKWEELVRRNPQYTFVQLGLPEETSIQGAVDLRGKTTVRESMALLKHSRSFVGVVSSMAHATNAFDIPGVVLFGPSTPEVWAHPNNKTITKKLRCAPCIDFLSGADCPYKAPCMSEITVEEVETALYTQNDPSTRAVF